MFLAFATSVTLLAQPAPSDDRIAQAIQTERDAAPACLRELAVGEAGQACGVYSGAVQSLRIVAGPEAVRQSSADRIGTMWRQRAASRHAREYGAAISVSTAPRY